LPKKPIPSLPSYLIFSALSTCGVVTYLCSLSLSLSLYIYIYIYIYIYMDYNLIALNHKMHVRTPSYQDALLFEKPKRGTARQSAPDTTVYYICIFVPIPSSVQLSTYTLKIFHYSSS
jgi:hypothetical protein